MKKSELRQIIREEIVKEIGMQAPLVNKLIQNAVNELYTQGALGSSRGTSKEALAKRMDIAKMVFDDFYEKVREGIEDDMSIGAYERISKELALAERNNKTK